MKEYIDFLKDLFYSIQEDPIGKFFSKFGNFLFYGALIAVAVWYFSTMWSKSQADKAMKAANSFVSLQGLWADLGKNPTDEQKKRFLAVYYAHNEMQDPYYTLGQIYGILFYEKFGSREEALTVLKDTNAKSTFRLWPIFCEAFNRRLSANIVCSGNPKELASYYLLSELLKGITYDKIFQDAEASSPYLKQLLSRDERKALFSFFSGLEDQDPLP